MKIPFESTESERKKWYKHPQSWILIIVLLLVLIIIILTTILLITTAKKNNTTHVHYTRINTNIYDGSFELYRLNVLSKRNPAQQYKLFGDFLRVSLLNQSFYENFLPLCPIIYSMSSIDHPEDWRGMLFGTKKFPSKNMPYPYICYLSVLPNNRRYKLGSILLNQFINDVAKNIDSPLTHIQLHTNWENCRAQKLYNRCGFRCNEFIPNGYSPPFEPEYQYGHKIRMELNLANIKNLANVCHVSQAVEISKEDEDNYAKLCDENLPDRLRNQTCEHKI